MARRYGVGLRRVTPDDWRDWRELRLLALSESPDAFGSSLSSWQDASEARWRSRLADVPCNLLVNDDATGAIVGQASGTAVDLSGVVELISMYVHPDARGTGVADALIEAIAEWAMNEGASALVLSVKRSNDRALRVYLRHGFEDRGDDGDEPDEQLLRRRLAQA